MSKRAYTVLPPDREEKVLGIFVRDASFYRTFFPLIFVIVLQQLAALAVNLADNIMLGRYSELALSGASLVNQLQFTLQQIAAGSQRAHVVHHALKDLVPILRHAHFLTSTPNSSSLRDCHQAVSAFA